jgi:CheY-like chemotaxis protein
MAGEPILIVDDTPVNLKLTRILLVNEGYQVSTAGSAEEALELLRSYHPKLILADIQLPGIDGLEMTRLIKGDERTRDITVVALSAFAMKGDEQRAIEAGCDGYITKPIDTRTLGRQIRELLDRRAGNPETALPDSQAESLPPAELRALRHRFLSEGQERARKLLLELDGEFHADVAARAVHQWIGTGGLLGFTAISRLAREVETLLHERPVDTAQVRESATSLMLAFTSPSEARDIPIPEAIIRPLRGKRLAVVGLPASETQRLCVALERAQAHAQVFELASTPEPQQLQSCDLLVVWVQAQSASSPWLGPASPAYRRPTLLVGNHDDLMALPARLQAVAGFLMDGWQPDEALVRLSMALMQKARRPSPSPEDGRRPVLIAGPEDASGTLLENLAGLGMEVHHASDGPQALDAAGRVQLHAAVLDIDLPGADGFELLARLRSQQPAMGVVILTGHQREDDLVRGFALGADDYVVKPFSPIELAARLNRLVPQ